MTFYEAYKFAITRLNLKEKDRKLESIVENGLNSAIGIVSGTYGKTKSVNFTPIKNTPYSLPSDFLNLQLLLQGSTILSENDFMIKGDFLLATDPEIAGTELTMIYSYVPPKMTLSANSNEELPVNNFYHSAVVSYACYHLALQTGRTDISDKYLSEFNMVTGIGVDKNARSGKKS